MSEQGIRLFASVITAAQAARQQLFQMGGTVPGCKSSQQDFRLAQLLRDMEDHAKDRFLKETLAVPMTIEKATARLSELLSKGECAQFIQAVGHNQDDTIHVYLTKANGAWVPEAYEGYKVVVQKIGKIVAGPAYPKGRRGRR